MKYVCRKTSIYLRQVNIVSHKALIGGVAYSISSGNTTIGGTGYDITGGKTLIGGTAYNIGFRVDPLIIYEGGDNVLVGTLAIGNYTTSTNAGVVGPPAINDTYGIVDGCIKVISAMGMVPGYGSSSRTIYATIGQIDITKYTTLHVLGYSSNVSNPLGIGSFGLTLVKANDNSNPSYEISGSLSNTTATEEIIDISSYAGNYYIKLASGGYGTAYFTKIWLT